MDHHQKLASNYRAFTNVWPPTVRYFAKLHYDMIAERRFGILECTGGIHVSGEGERPICKRDDASSDPRDYLG
ncbi:hypothetical protein YC2023_041448 [Brassica napus]